MRAGDAGRQLNIALGGLELNVVNDCGEQNVPWLTAVVQKSTVSLRDWSSQVRWPARRAWHTAGVALTAAVRVGQTRAAPVAAS